MKKNSLVIGLISTLVLMSLYSVAVQSGEAPRNVETQEDAIDVALDYILNSHEELSRIRIPSSWVEQNLVYEDLVGYYVVQYISSMWTVEVGNAVVQKPVYDIEVEFTGELNFFWKGTVGQSGNVVEAEFVMKN